MHQISLGEKHLENTAEEEMNGIYTNLPEIFKNFNEVQENFNQVSDDLTYIKNEIKVETKEKELFDNIKSYSNLNEKTGNLIQDLEITLGLEDTISKLKYLIQNNEDLQSVPDSDSDFIIELKKIKRILGYIINLSKVYPLYEKAEIVWELCQNKIDLI